MMRAKRSLKWCDSTDSWTETKELGDFPIPQAYPTNLAEHLEELNAALRGCPKLVDTEKSRRMSESARKAAYLKRKRMEAQNERI